MVMGKKIATTIMLVAAVCFMGACARDQLKVEPIARSENPIEHINRLDNDIGNARKNQVNVLAPTWFAKADMSLKDAKAILDRGGELSKVLQKIADGRAQLQRAEEMAQLARTALPIPLKLVTLLGLQAPPGWERTMLRWKNNFLSLRKPLRTTTSNGLGKIGQRLPRLLINLSCEQLRSKPSVRFVS